MLEAVPRSQGQGEDTITLLANLVEEVLADSLHKDSESSIEFYGIANIHLFCGGFLQFNLIEATIYQYMYGYVRSIPYKRTASLSLWPNTDAIKEKKNIFLVAETSEAIL